MENRICSERGENKRTSAPTREKRWGTLVKKGILSALVLALTLSAFAACDGPDETETGTGSPDATIGEGNGSGNGENDADFDFGPLLGQIDFTDLLFSTEGQEKVDEFYNRYLDGIEKNPNAGYHPGTRSQYVRSIMSDSGSKRRNIMLEITNAENDRWSYVLISTTDDFAVVARDSKEREDYIVGFMDDRVVDEAGYLSSTDRAAINDMLMSEGYDATMNQVRDEFFGQLLLLSTLEGEDYVLAINGGMKNVYNDYGFRNAPEDFIYEIQFISILDWDTGEDVTRMDATYDIPDNYLGTKLGS